MAKDWVSDIHKMHKKYGVHEAVAALTPDQRMEFLRFRIAFLREELEEIESMANNPEEVVDGFIDSCVVSIGTLDLFGVNPYKAWNAVHKANMAKEVGIKPGRPNPLGLPDLIKPAEWKAPSHKGNHGSIPIIDPINKTEEKSTCFIKRFLQKTFDKIKG